VTTNEGRVLRGVWTLERDQVIQVGKLRGIEKFEGEIENKCVPHVCACVCVMYTV